MFLLSDEMLSNKYLENIINEVIAMSVSFVFSNHFKQGIIKMTKAKHKIIAYQHKDT